MVIVVMIEICGQDVPRLVQNDSIIFHCQGRQYVTQDRPYHLKMYGVEAPPVDHITILLSAIYV